MLDADVVAFVLGALSGHERVLEVGAGSGELAQHLRAQGHKVRAIDPARESPGVERVALAELDEPADGFDAALAVLSLHHVSPLAESCERLATVVRSGGVLVIDEFDIAAFDLEAMQWWLAQGPEVHVTDPDPRAILAEMRAHLHPLGRVLTALDPWFEFGETTRGPYLYRWGLDPSVRRVEEEQLAAGLLPATGARAVGRRRSTPRRGPD